MNRRQVLGVLAGASLLSGCSAERFFSLEWTEEVQLHDGRVILVKVKNRYRRLGLLLFRKLYEPARFLSTEISFNAGAPIGVFSQIFESYVVAAIEQMNGNWFLILEQRYGGMGQKWGMPEDLNGHVFLRIAGPAVVPAPAAEFGGGELLKTNMLLDNAEVDDFAQFNGGFVSLRRKSEFLSKHPQNPGEDRIRRRAQSTASS